MLNHHIIFPCICILFSIGACCSSATDLENRSKAGDFDKIGDFICNFSTQEANVIRICGRFGCDHGAIPTHYVDLVVQDKTKDYIFNVKVDSVSLERATASELRETKPTPYLLNRGF